MIKRWFFSNWIPIAFCCWGLLHFSFFWGAGFNIYLSPWLRELALIAGIVLMSLAVLWPFLPSCHSHGEAHEHDHHFDVKSLLQFSVILFPVVLCLWVKPSEFSVTTLENRGISSTALPGMKSQLTTEELFSGTDEDFAPEEHGISEVTVSDLLFTAEDPQLRKKFLNKTVKVIGQPIFSSSSHFQLTRLFIVCCAADAKPVGLWMDSVDQVPLKLQKADWLEVEGKLTFQSKTNHFVPYIEVTSVKKIETPEEVFLY